MKRTLNLFFVAFVSLIALAIVSCESDDSEVGGDMVGDGSTSNAMYIDVVSYNENPDSIRSDQMVLQSAVLGVYEDAVFGKTKAKFISQVRLGTINPDFGKNPKVDSVVLSIPVYYKTGTENIKTDTTYIYKAPENSSDSDTILIKRTYQMDSIFGNKNSQITLQVKEVSDYLYSIDSAYYSNPNLREKDNIGVYPEVIGSGQISKEVVTEQIRAADNTTQSEPTVAHKIYLDAQFFQDKFIANQNSSNLADQASFIRNLLRGIEISTLEDQGFLFNFNPNSTAINIYYSYDNEAEESEEKRLTKTLSLSFSSFWGGGYNVQINQYEHSNQSGQFTGAYTNPNKSAGDSRLYLSGLSGTRAVVEINKEQLETLRDNVANKQWAVVGAELVFHPDETFSEQRPEFIFAWEQYKSEGSTKSKVFSDITEFYNSYPYVVQFNPRYDFSSNTNPYTIRITDYIKNIVEKDDFKEDAKIIVSLGNFLMSPSNYYSTVYSNTNPFYNNRAFNPYRLILHGNASENADKKLQLKIYYTKR